MLELALKAKLPFIGIHTDDPVNVKAIISVIANKKVLAVPSNISVGDSYVYLIEDMKEVTVNLYRRLCDTGTSAIVLNPEKQNYLVFDSGVLVVPPEFFVGYLKDFVDEDKIPAILSVLNGLSLKTAQEIVQLTMARTGAALPSEIRHTRMMLGGSTPGLYTLDTDYDFYEMPLVLQEWIDLNDKYFLDPTTPQKLVPRGVLLVGDPGVGKSMASMVLAHHWSVPLFRLDISTSLNRYLGESDSRVARNLSILEANAPCIFLLDEVEKQFGLGGDEGTISRILTQILWWTASHKSRILTVMTSNDISKLPTELYRPGRIDRVIKIQKLTVMEAKIFSFGVYKSIVGKEVSVRKKAIICETIAINCNYLKNIDNVTQPTFSHAEITELVYSLIKKHNWLVKE